MPALPPPAEHCQWANCYLPPEFRVGTKCADHGKHVDDYCKRHYLEVKNASLAGSYLCGEPSTKSTGDCDLPMQLSEPIEIRKIVTHDR